MSYTVKKREKSEVEISITVPKEEYQKHLETAAKKISERTAIKGFRKGHVPFDILKKEVGEMAILQEGLEKIVQESFYSAIKAEGLETIGMPKIEVEKLAPGNDVVFKAVVGLLPKVSLADLSKISIKMKKKGVEASRVEETLEALRGMHAKEVTKEGPAAGTDKLVIDMDMLLDNVPIEGGQAKNYQVYLSEDHYIPGFNAAVTGLKKDEEKQFSLDFPDTHYQKQLAGKRVDFKVKVTGVFERQLPELSDDLAKKMGQESVAKLKELVQNNLEEEAEQKALETAEIEMLDTIIERSSFEPIPDVIIDAEKQKMFYELKRDLERHGVGIDQYLADLKKTEEELFKDFHTQAEKRAKAALVSRHIALTEHMSVSPEELEKELQMMASAYKEDADVLEKLKRPEVRDSVATTIQNKKVMAWLKERLLEEENGAK